MAGTTAGPQTPRIYGAAARQAVCRGGGDELTLLASLAAHWTAATIGAHPAGEYAVHGLTEAASRKRARSGTTVNAHVPGVVGTTIRQAADAAHAEMTGRDPEETHRTVVGVMPLWRVQTAHDRAALTPRLAAPGSDHMTGQTIDTAGGPSVAGLPS